MSKLVTVLTIIDNDGKKRVVGKSDGKTFYRRVSSDKHLIVNRNSWAIDAAVLVNYIVKNGCMVVIYDRLVKKYYVASHNTFQALGRNLHLPDQRPQISLHLSNFTVYDRKLPAVYDISDLEYRG